MSYEMISLVALIFLFFKTFRKMREIVEPNPLIEWESTLGTYCIVSKWIIQALRVAIIITMAVCVLKFLSLFVITEKHWLFYSPNVNAYTLSRFLRLINALVIFSSVGF